MCLIFISLNNHPDYKLIVAANRDEFYQRKTAPAQWWDDAPQVLGGRDLEAQGTWMGVSKTGRVSMITNFRDVKNIKTQAPSRGQLVSDYLENAYAPKSYLESIEPKAREYNGFNLLVGDQDELWYLSNYKDGATRLTSGFFGLSNHLLETPWPKVVRGKESVKAILTSRVFREDDLFSALADENIAPDDQLPATGLPLDRERALSAMFIKTPNYGTRCSTVIMINKDNEVTFAERVFDLETFTYSTQRFNFSIE